MFSVARWMTLLPCICCSHKGSSGSDNRSPRSMRFCETCPGLSSTWLARFIEEYVPSEQPPMRVVVPAYICFGAGQSAGIQRRLSGVCGILIQRFEKFLHIFGQWRLTGQHFSSMRVLQGDCARMQCLAWKSLQHVNQWLTCTPGQVCTPVINRVTHKRVFQPGHMHAYLMCTPGFQLQTDMRM